MELYCQTVEQLPIFYNEKGHQAHKDAASASADAVRAGTDLECGSSYRSLKQSVELGLIGEEEINVSVTRLMKARFELGEMDELSDVAWSAILIRWLPPLNTTRWHWKQPENP